MKKLFFHTPFFAETGENSKRKGLVKHNAIFTRPFVV